MGDQSFDERRDHRWRAAIFGRDVYERLACLHPVAESIQEPGTERPMLPIQFLPTPQVVDESDRSTP